MRKKVEEQKVERFKAEVAVQHDQNRLRAKEGEDARIEKAMTNLQTEKEEREIIMNASEMRFSDISDIEKNYKFNHEFNDRHDNKSNDGKRRMILLNLIFLHRKKHATNEDVLDDDRLKAMKINLTFN